jgi:hypothetical protein
MAAAIHATVHFNLRLSDYTYVLHSEGPKFKSRFGNWLSCQLFLEISIALLG